MSGRGRARIRAVGAGSTTNSDTRAGHAPLYLIDLLVLLTVSMGAIKDFLANQGRTPPTPPDPGAPALAQPVPVVAAVTTGTEHES